MAGERARGGGARTAKVCVSYGAPSPSTRHAGVGKRAKSDHCGRYSEEDSVKYRRTWSRTNGARGCHRMGCSLVCVYVLFCLNSNDFGLSLYLHWLRTRATAGRPGPGPGASKASSYTAVKALLGRLLHPCTAHLSILALCKVDVDRRMLNPATQTHWKRRHNNNQQQHQQPHCPYTQAHYVYTEGKKSNQGVERSGTLTSLCFVWLVSEAV